MLNGEERRKYIRIFLPGEQVRLVSGILLVRVGKVIDLSLGGIQFVCSSDFDLGDKVSIEVVLPSGLKLQCTASICHTEKIENNPKESIYGAQFVSLCDNEKSELGAFIMKKRAEQDGLLSKKIT